MKTLLTDLDLSEVSLVDKGANPGALITLFKRAEPVVADTTALRLQTVIAKTRMALSKHGDGPNSPEHSGGGDEVPMVGGHIDFRYLGKQKKFPISDKFGVPKIGSDIDFYDSVGDKQYGRVLAIAGSTIKFLNHSTKKRVMLQMVDEKSGKKVR